LNSFSARNLLGLQRRTRPAVALPCG